MYAGTYTGTAATGTWQFTANIPDGALMSFAYSIFQPPASLSLATNGIGDQLPVGTLAGTLSSVDYDVTTTFTYTFDTTCAGTLDNSKFTISSNQLLINYVFQYPTQTGATVCLKTTNGNGLSLT